MWFWILLISLLAVGVYALSKRLASKQNSVPVRVRVDRKRR